jgi:hypothetical protein
MSIQSMQVKHAKGRIGVTQTMVHSMDVVGGCNVEWD